ncbi:tectonic-3-like [Lepeophtheirus salmonis]|uniref:Tectonic domain-containing protein n=1 Tax=Lepeophtheirus salmonis TaxID=72036 RepID=A0A0K2TW89_LEPSM|nr:tectonic-3-like [Lepeophtheirus salmonis]
MLRLCLLFIHFLGKANSNENSSDPILFPIKPFCLCDLTSNECNIDCCCDIDCSKEDMDSFRICINQSEPFDNSIYCGSSKSLFCLIPKDTEPPEYELYKNKKSITDIKTFDEILSRHPRFQWMSKSTHRSVRPYKYNDLVYAQFNNNTIGGLYIFPNMPVLYMNNEELIFKDNVYNVSYLPSGIIANPADPDHIIDIEWTLCTYHENHMDCIDKEPPELVDSANYECLFLEILHNGIYGIKEVTIMLKQRKNKVPVVENNLLMIGYRHRFWRNETNETDSLPIIKHRSGNPGYIMGKPVLITEIDQNMTSYEFKDEFAYYGFFPNGHCNDPHRRKISILFGENIRTGCVLEVGDLSCSEIYKEISEIYSFNLDSLYIGSFGNADIEKNEDWINILSKNNFALLQIQDNEDMSCSLPQSLHIKILYSNVGSFSDPQRKIVGCLFSYGLSENLQRNGRSMFSIYTSFIDISEPAEIQFAEFPVIEAKFPHDFFYPFFVSCSINLTASYLLLIIIVALIF